MASEMRNLNAALWAAADEMRKVMSADVYKDYYIVRKLRWLIAGSTI